MAVVLTVTAPGPAALAELWARLGGHHAQVDIVGDDISISVDLTTPADDEPDDEADEDLVDPVEVVRQTYIAEAEAAEEPEPQAANVVGIDRKARAEHPTGGTLVAKVLGVFAAEPGQTFSPSDIIDGLDEQGVSYSGVTSTLVGLVRNGQVERVGRGQYRAVTQ